MHITAVMTDVAALDAVSMRYKATCRQTLITTARFKPATRDPFVHGTTHSEVAQGVAQEQETVATTTEQPLNHMQERVTTLQAKTNKAKIHRRWFTH